MKKPQSREWSMSEVSAAVVDMRQPWAKRPSSSKRPSVVWVFPTSMAKNMGHLPGLVNTSSYAQIFTDVPQPF